MGYSIAAQFENDELKISPIYVFKLERNYIEELKQKTNGFVVDPFQAQVFEPIECHVGGKTEAEREIVKAD